MAARKTHKSFLLTPCNDVGPTKDTTKPVSIPMLTLLPFLQHCVADPGCLSRIPDPDFSSSRIQDLESRIQNQQKKRGMKKISCHTFYCSHKFHKIENYFIFEMPKKTIWANFQRIMELFTQKMSLSSQKYGFGIGDPGPRGQKALDHGSGSAKLLQHELILKIFY
jgi:hypothetical protein